MQLLFFKFKGPLLKPKSKIYFFQFLFWILQDSYSHLAQLPMITMTLKWHQKNISNKIIVLKKNWQLSEMVFGLFDFDYTPKLNYFFHFIILLTKITSFEIFDYSKCEKT